MEIPDTFEALGAHAVLPAFSRMETQREWPVNCCRMDFEIASERSV